jgi:acetyl esterase
MKSKPVAAAGESRVDPEIQAFAGAIQQGYARLAQPGEITLEHLRHAAETVRKPWVQGGPAMWRISDHRVPRNHGHVRIRLFEPGAATDSPALVYLHGGGWTVFSLHTHDRLMRELAARTGFKVIGVDFSLAPEHKFPHQIDEIEQVVEWLQSKGPALGVDPSRLCIGGDSAGANLALATCLRRRDRNLDSGFGAMLLCYGAFEAGKAFANHGAATDPSYLLTHEEMAGFWRNYLRGPADVNNPLACPMHADLHGLPPAFLVIAECDILLEENLAMAARLGQAGVTVEAVVYPGTTHSFLEAVSIAPVSDRALAEASSWLSKTILGSE